MSIWTGHFLGGFAGQSDPKLDFNWHPLLLTISLIYLYGNGILIYRLARNERKSKLKVAVTDESEVLNFVAMTLYVAGDTFSIHESEA